MNKTNTRTNERPEAQTVAPMPAAQSKRYDALFKQQGVSSWNPYMDMARS